VTNAPCCLFSRFEIDDRISTDQSYNHTSICYSLLVRTREREEKENFIERTKHRKMIIIKTVRQHN